VPIAAWCGCLVAVPLCAGAVPLCAGTGSLCAPMGNGRSMDCDPTTQADPEVADCVLPGKTGACRTERYFKCVGMLCRTLCYSMGCGWIYN